jgi:hypothetical protein
MSDEDKLVVHTENDEAAAQIVVGYLSANGIHAEISEDDAGNQLPSMETVRGVKIWVREADAERAAELLASRD